MLFVLVAFIFAPQPVHSSSHLFFTYCLLPSRWIGIIWMCLQLCTHQGHLCRCQIIHQHFIKFISMPEYTQRIPVPKDRGGVCVCMWGGERKRESHMTPRGRHESHQNNNPSPTATQTHTHTCLQGVPNSMNTFNVYTDFLNRTENWAAGLMLKYV